MNLFRILYERLYSEPKSVPSDCMAFILHIIQNRQSQDFPLSGLTSILRFDGVSEDARSAIMDVTAGLLNGALDTRMTSHSDWEMWMKDALVQVLLSVSGHTMTEDGRRILARCMSSLEDRWSVIHLVLSLDPCAVPLTGYECYRGVSERLGLRIAGSSESESSMPSRFEEIADGAIHFIQASLCNDMYVHGHQLGELFAAHPGQFLIFSRVICFLMASATTDKNCPQEIFSRLSGFDNILRTMFSIDQEVVALTPIHPSVSNTEYPTGSQMRMLIER